MANFSKKDCLGEGFYVMFCEGDIKRVSFDDDLDEIADSINEGNVDACIAECGYDVAEIEDRSEFEFMAGYEGDIHCVDYVELPTLEELFEEDFNERFDEDESELSREEAFQKMLDEVDDIDIDNKLENMEYYTSMNDPVTYSSLLDAYMEYKEKVENEEFYDDDSDYEGDDSDYWDEE